MDKGAARYFTSVIHEFTQAIGKENFYLIGEITGGRQNAFTTLEETGMNAALGIDDIPSKIEETVKGYADPIGYFNLFRNSELVQKESHVWFRDKVVTLFDDHDQVRKGEKKARFCAYSNDWQKLVVNAMAFNVLTMGIPCIYYGTEQCFDGEGGSDRYIREAMFGGEFGAFRSKNRHFFNEQTPAYKEISKISKIRKQELALRRGRQYLRQISGNGIDFGFPQKIGDRMLSVLPWSRIFSDTEILCAINTDPNNSRSAWVVIDKDLHKIGDFLTCLYSSDPGQTGSKIEVTEKYNDCSLVDSSCSRMCDIQVGSQVLEVRGVRKGSSPPLHPRTGKIVKLSFVCIPECPEQEILRQNCSFHIFTSVSNAKDLFQNILIFQTQKIFLMVRTSPIVDRIFLSHRDDLS